MAEQHGAMDAQTVADLLGISTRHLNNYINLKDLPSQGSGRRRTFVWAEVREWYVQYRMAIEGGDGNDGSEDPDFDADSSDGGARKKEDIRAATLRKTRAEADLKQLALSKQRSEVITIADAKMRLDRTFSNLRAKLLSIAPKLANRLESERDRTLKEAAIKDEMESLCRELSTGAIVDVVAGAPEPDTLDAIEASDASGNLDALREVAELLGVYDSL